MNQTLLSNKLHFTVFLAYLRLTRPANVITAMADVTAGYSIAATLASGGMPFFPPVWLLLATACLYAGGVVFNDVFDYKIDLKERPERPIPSGKVPLLNAGILGAALLLLGVVFALMVNIWCGVLALCIALFALLYDGWGKHYALIGPINMGMCRSLNLMLGVVVVPAVVAEIYYIALIPLVYIFSVTLVSREEVKGGNYTALYAALALFCSVIIFLGWLSVQYGTLSFSWIFLALLALFVLGPLVKAIAKPSPGNVQQAVKFGVISLIILNACLASVYSGWEISLAILSLLPLSFLISKLFAVT
ncbi:UbiA-like protein EboC [Cytophagaceae bacterium ABcell3]|nr:UbiA-like protein EboC [Cytophagaceae bacterium ABcell3]